MRQRDFVVADDPVVEVEDVEGPVRADLQIDGAEPGVGRAQEVGLFDRPDRAPDGYALQHLFEIDDRRSRQLFAGSVIAKGFKGTFEEEEHIGGRLSGPALSAALVRGGSESSK